MTTIVHSDDGDTEASKGPSTRYPRSQQREHCTQAFLFLLPIHGVGPTEGLFHSKMSC